MSRENTPTSSEASWRSPSSYSSSEEDGRAQSLDNWIPGFRAPPWVPSRVCRFQLSAEDELSEQSEYSEDYVSSDFERPQDTFMEDADGSTPSRAISVSSRESSEAFSTQSRSVSISTFQQPNFHRSSPFLNVVAPDIAPRAGMSSEERLGRLLYTRAAAVESTDGSITRETTIPSSKRGKIIEPYYKNSYPSFEEENFDSSACQTPISSMTSSADSDVPTLVREIPRRSEAARCLWIDPNSEVRQYWRNQTSNRPPSVPPGGEGLLAEIRNGNVNLWLHNLRTPTPAPEEDSHKARARRFTHPQLRDELTVQLKPKTLEILRKKEYDPFWVENHGVNKLAFAKHVCPFHPSEVVAYGGLKTGDEMRFLLGNTLQCAISIIPNHLKRGRKDFSVQLKEPLAQQGVQFFGIKSLGELSTLIWKLFHPEADKGPPLRAKKIDVWHKGLFAGNYFYFRQAFNIYDTLLLYYELEMGLEMHRVLRRGKHGIKYDRKTRKGSLYPIPEDDEEEVEAKEESEDKGDDVKEDEKGAREEWGYMGHVRDGDNDSVMS